MSDDDRDDDEAADDRDLHELDDRADRNELRQRYYGLLQELRVVLPGVQVLVAFLLTVPFAQRFPELDDWGRFAYGLSLIASMLSVICLLTPTVYHRMAKRTERTARLRWGIRMTIAGQWLIAVALVSALWCVSRLVFGLRAAWVMATPVALAIVACWLLLPMLSGSKPDSRPDRPEA
jgi:hypothetical protein